jgi:adenylate cyclase
MVIPRRELLPGLIGVVVLALLLAGWVGSPDAVRGILRERAFDRILPLLPRHAPTEPGVVIVDIDRAALTQFGPWPWPRKHLADLVAAVAQGHPTAISLDILLAGTDRFSGDGDTALALALSGAPTVLGFVLETEKAGEHLPVTPILARSPAELPGLWQAHGVIGPLGSLGEKAQGFGALALAADPDGLIRRVPLLVRAGDVVRPGLAAETVRLVQGAGALILLPNGILQIGTILIPLGRDAALRLSDRPAARMIPAGTVLDDPAARAALLGRVVLIGSSAPEVGGLRATPVSPATPSVQIQAAAIGAILSGEIPVRPIWADLGEPIAAVVLALLCLAIATWLRPAGAGALAVLACLTWMGATVAAVPAASLFVDPVGPPVIAVASFAAALVARFIRDEWRARLLRLRFEQHLSPDVVRRIAADPEALRLRGEMRQITALFTDIESFTSMTERAEPTELIALLDTYFDVGTRIITDHGGMIDKIVGDAIVAIYNAPLDLQNHPQCAVASALALVEATENIRRSPLGQRLRLGRTRIGVETGPAIVGDVGGSRKLDYTAHGNVINAAARLEAANKELGSSICIGPGAAARLNPDTLRQIGRLTLRGQSSEISVYTPVALATSFKQPEATDEAN